MANNNKNLSVVQLAGLKLLGVNDEQKESIEKILLSETQDVKLEEAMLIDGETKIKAESFEAGASVFIEGEDGQIPAPEGEHTLEDGRVLVLDEEGKILEIKVKDSEEEMSSDEVLAGLQAEVKAIKEKLELAEQEKAAKETELAETKTALSAVEKAFQELSDSPATVAPTVAPDTRETTVKMSAAEESKMLASMTPRERAMYEYEKRQN